MERSEIEWMPIASIRPYDKNPRRNDAAVDAVANSITEFGFKNPIIVDSDLVIIAGHTRLKAAKKLGLKEVPVVIASDLSEEQVRAYRLADNKTGELAEWDDDLLNAELDAITGIDMSEFGFEIKEIQAEPEEDDYEPELEEDPMSKVGDIYLLGDHVLIVGDATSTDDLRKLFNVAGGGGADMVLTDPPYNVAYTGKTAKGLTIENDSMSPEVFREFLFKAFSNADDHLKPGGAFYIWYASKASKEFEGACEDTGWEIRQTLIWSKSNFVLGRQDYQWKHEPCLYGWKDGAAHHFIENRTLSTILEEMPIDLDGMKKDDMRKLLERILNSDVPTTVIHADKPSRNAEHPTMKPIKLLAQLIRNSSETGDTILDMFGGSGSTLIACEQMGRRCLTMELDPRYADVIVDRWETYTGREAVLMRENT